MCDIKRKIRFSGVAHAIDLKPKAFRNWLQRNELHLLSDHKTRNWTEWTLADVAVLAVTREIVRWGIGVDTANECAYLVIHSKAAELLKYRNTPAEAFVAALTGAALVLHSPDDPDGPISVMDGQDVDFAFNDYGSAAWINVQKCVADAFQRIEGEGAE